MNDELRTICQPVLSNTTCTGMQIIFLLKATAGSQIIFPEKANLKSFFTAHYKKLPLYKRKPPHSLSMAWKPNKPSPLMTSLPSPGLDKGGSGNPGSCEGGSQL